MPLKINNIKSLNIKLCKTYNRIKVSLGISVLNSNELCVIKTILIFFKKRKF